MEEIEIGGQRLSPNRLSAGHGSDWMDFASGMLGMVAGISLSRFLDWRLHQNWPEVQSRRSNNQIALPPPQSLPKIRKWP